MEPPARAGDDRVPGHPGELVSPRGLGRPPHPQTPPELTVGLPPPLFFLFFVQATYTFPVGVTTLWWYAPATSFAGNATEAQVSEFDGMIYADAGAGAGGAQQPMVAFT